MALPLPRSAAAVTAVALALAAVLAAPVLTPTRVDGAVPPAHAVAGSEQEARLVYADLPLSFEANQGQTDRRVRYLARGEDFDLFLTERGAVFDLHAPGSHRAAAIRLAPVGARVHPDITGRRYQGATASYFRGNDPSGWSRGVRTYARARYHDLYPGIDLVFRGDRSGAEYDFVLDPGADPTRIGYRLRGADSLRLRDGALVARTAAGSFVHRAPVAYQVVAGHRQRVDAFFRITRGVVTFDVGAYDRHLPLVIDPDTELVYNTYLGGSDDEGSYGIAVDGGDMYLTGYTTSPDFPTTTGAYDTTRSPKSDVVVVRLSPDGAGSADLVYSAFLGGNRPDDSSFDETGADIKVADGDAYVVGYTTAPDFPTTAGALDRSLGGAQDAFVARLSLDAAGAADLVYSSYLGGSQDDTAVGLVADAGDVYVAGRTSSADFPVTAGSVDTTMTGGDAFVTRISPDGAGASDLVYSTFFGGGGADYAAGIALRDGDIYLAGGTQSADLPTTTGAFDLTLAGSEDTYLARISPDGAGPADLLYSTYLGGRGVDRSGGIALDADDVFVTGWTSSKNFPTTAGAYDRTFKEDPDGFMARFSPDGAGAADLTYATFVGGYGEDYPSGIVVDGEDVFVASTIGYYDKYGGDTGAIVFRIVPDSGGRSDARHIGAVDTYDDETATAIAVADGKVFLTGSTDSDSLDTTAGAFDSTSNGQDDAFAAVLDLSVDNIFNPDAMVRRGEGPTVGDDVYYGDELSQGVSVRARKQQQRTFWFTAQNDDNGPDTFRISGFRPSTRKWAFHYYVGDTEVTSTLFETPVLASGDEVVVKVTIKPRRKATVGSTECVSLRVTSLGDPIYAVDDASACVRVKRG